MNFYHRSRIVSYLFFIDLNLSVKIQNDTFKDPSCQKNNNDMYY